MAQSVLYGVSPKSCEMAETSKVVAPRCLADDDATVEEEHRLNLCHEDSGQDGNPEPAQSSITVTPTTRLGGTYSENTRY